MSAYPPDFTSWGEDKRNSYIADEAKRYRESTKAPEPTGNSHDPQFTEDRLALDFAEKHSHDLRYAAKWGRWLKWLGSKWASDDTLDAYTLARKICREAAARCNKPSISSALSKAKTVAAVETMARSDDALKATTSQWDANPWDLNARTTHTDLKRF